jgi:hypothetical protein
MSTSIGLDGDRGAVTFPVNAHRGEPIWVDVAQRAASGAEVAAAAAAGERFLGDVVTVTARDATGAAVTSVPYQVVLGSAGRDARAVVKDVVPGVRVTVGVDGHGSCVIVRLDTQMITVSRALSAQSTQPTRGKPAHNGQFVSPLENAQALPTRRHGSPPPRSTPCSLGLPKVRTAARLPKRPTRTVDIIAAVPKCLP